MLNIKKQISKLYLSTVLGTLSLTGAWVALLAANGYSLAQIGIAETVFHITSLIFEIPSGVLADLFGRKRMLLVSGIMRIIANVVMILSGSLFTVCISFCFNAMSYNFSSGSGDALAYDSLKRVGDEEYYERYASNQLILYRICNGASTLCAGVALFIGYKAAYGINILIGAAQIAALSSLREVRLNNDGCKPEKNVIASVKAEFISYFKTSLSFLRREKRTVFLMLCNSLVGAFDVLLLFFLQAKLPEAGVSAAFLGVSLLIMEAGGILGAKLVLKCKKLSYRKLFALAALLAISGVLAEHSGLSAVMILGGFIAALSDDALQVRTDTKLQNMFPSEQRATLISIESFTFSIVMIVLSPLAGILFSRW